MTETTLTPEQITTLGISAKRKGDKFVYTVPEQISLGKLRDIPVVSDNSSLVGNWTREFNTPQTIALQINNAHDKVTAQIIFTDAPKDATTITEAKQESLIASLDKIDDIRNAIQ